MNQRRLTSVLTALLLVTAAFAQREGCLWWGYNHEAGIPDNYLGVSKSTVYEAAIRVDGTTAPTIGSTLTAVRLPFRSAEHIDSLTLWLTTELGQENVASIFVGQPIAGWNVVELPQPVSIPQTGLYVGYTFRVNELDGMSERPLVMCNTISDDGLNLRIADVKSYANWYNTKRYGSLAMQLELAGPAFAANDVSVDALATNNLLAQTQDSVVVTLTNYGTSAPETLQYSYTYADEAYSTSCTLSSPLPRVWGAQNMFSVPVEAPVATGRLQMFYTLAGVNGSDNQNQQNTAQAELFSLARSTHRRTVMEEYTGTWCSACPRGFAGIARLKEAYPDDFIAVSVHVLNGDPMDVYYDYYYVMNATLFPSCRFDRGELTDPYDGDFSDGHFHADLNYLAAHRKLAPADLTVQAQWTSETTCLITAEANFAYDAPQCEFALAYIMTEDSLRGPEGDKSWFQMNSFPQMPYYVEEDMQQYVNAEGTLLHDVAYNDVVTAMSDVRGINGSLEGTQTAGQPMSHTYEMELPTISQDKRNIHIVALLIDKTTRLVANAAICSVQASAGISSIQRSAPASRPATYDLQGRNIKASHARHGSILVARQADGSFHKTIIR
ncbi:MAG: hypothetical protein IJ570_08120 [Prevotella sp.]|nr:hypothetical protein [Prevotella sp.]